MTARQTGIVAFCAGLAGFALAFFAFDPSRIILGESAARVRKLERTALDLRKAMYARIAQTRTRVVDVAPKPLDAKHFSVVDTRPSWAFLSFRSGATRFLYDVGTNTFNGRYSTTPIARYGWKAVISNNGDKAADLYAYVRIIDRSGQTVTGDLLQVKLPPFTARRFRGLVNYLASALSQVGSLKIELAGDEVNDRS